MRAIVDTKGEAFAYLQGTHLYSLERELCGRLEGEFIVDQAGQPKWRVSGDGIYTLDGFQPIGYIGSELPEEYDF